MKKRKWQLLVLGIAFIGLILLVENGQAASEKSIPAQVAELLMLFSNQQKEIASLKETVSELGADNSETTRTKGVLTTKAIYIERVYNYGGTVSSDKYSPIVGGKVTVMNSQGEKWTGTLDTQGTYSFTLPEGIYSVRLESSSKYFNIDWQLTTISSDKPRTIDYSHHEDNNY